MHEFGTTKQQLGEVALAARAWALHNPEAMMRDPLTMEDYLGSRLISDPLGKLDCCLVTDGAAALVLTRADRARDCASQPVYLAGAASMTSHANISQMPDLTTTALAECGPRALAQAGLRPGDIDVVQLYDAFTINTILFLEDLGFCPKGEGGRFVEGGRIAPGGALPVNTNGGGLSCLHPGMYGMFTMLEAVRQLRGECGERQVAGARTAIAQGNGGVLSAQSVCIFTAEKK
jgi:acetyl-CoA acetyltransferase